LRETRHATHVGVATMGRLWIDSLAEHCDRRNIDNGIRTRRGRRRVSSDANDATRTLTKYGSVVSAVRLLHQAHTSTRLSRTPQQHTRAPTQLHVAVRETRQCDAVGAQLERAAAAACDGTCLQHTARCHPHLVITHTRTRSRTCQCDRHRPARADSEHAGDRRHAARRRHDKLCVRSDQ
jgi:hypothetical protein